VRFGNGDATSFIPKINLRTIRCVLNLFFWSLFFLTHLFFLSFRLLYFQFKDSLAQGIILMESSSASASRVVRAARRSPSTFETTGLCKSQRMLGKKNERGDANLKTKPTNMRTRTPLMFLLITTN